MAVTHSIAHTHHEQPEPPSKLLTFINRHLAARYTTIMGIRHGILWNLRSGRPAAHLCRAGHNPPRLRRHGSAEATSLDRAENLPLGIDAGEIFHDVTETLFVGDLILFYTDGITESRDPTGDLFGVPRLDEILCRCPPDPEMIIRTTLIAIEDFTRDAAPTDDLTLLVARVR